MIAFEETGQSTSSKEEAVVAGLAAGHAAGRAVRKRGARDASDGQHRAMAKADAILVRRFCTGDEEAFNEIVVRHRTRVFAAANAILKNHADAEEICQDTFIRAHRSLAVFRGESALSTWLHCIALNLARNRYSYFRCRRRHLTLPLDAPVAGDYAASLGDCIATEEVDPARSALLAELSEVLTLCMDHLDEDTREILMLRNNLNQSYEKIALKQGLTLGTVKSRLSRARARLRILLSQVAPDFPVDSPIETWFGPVHIPAGKEALCA